MSYYHEGYRDYFRGKMINPYEGPNGARWAFGWQAAYIDQLHDPNTSDEFFRDPSECGYDDFIAHKCINPWDGDSVEGQDWTKGWSQAQFDEEEWST